MKFAGVDSALVIPMDASDNQRALNEYVEADRAKFAAVMVIPLGSLPAPQVVAKQLETWKATRGVVGIRTSFYHKDVRHLLVDEELDWLWGAAADLQLPVMINAAENVERVGGIAKRHPSLRISLDHMGFAPFKIYGDPLGSVAPALRLAEFDNIAIKATGLPSVVTEPYPFPALHSVIKEAVRCFGAERVFWGTDWTRLNCDYQDVVRLFTEAIDFLDESELVLIMGQALRKWVNWEQTVE